MTGFFFFSVSDKQLPDIIDDQNPGKDSRRRLHFPGIIELNDFSVPQILIAGNPQKTQREKELAPLHRPFHKTCLSILHILKRADTCKDQKKNLKHRKYLFQPGNSRRHLNHLTEDGQ